MKDFTFESYGSYLPLTECGTSFIFAGVLTADGPSVFFSSLLSFFFFFFAGPSKAGFGSSDYLKKERNLTEINTKHPHKLKKNFRD